MKTFLNFRNNLTMLYKNLPDKDLKRVMRWRWFLDYLAAFETLIINRHWGDFCAIFRARRAFKKWRHAFDADRKAIVGHSSGPDGRKPYSILAEYYLHGHKKYSDIKQL
jgi:hypothetical protein